MKYFLALFISLIFIACSMTNKINIGQELTKIKIENISFALDSLKANPDLFEKKDISKSILPNPQIVLFMQDLARGIINTKLGNAFLSLHLKTKYNTTDSAKILFVKKAEATVLLDSLYELPLKITENQTISLKKDTLKVSTILPVDSRLFKILDTDTLYIQGFIDLALDTTSTGARFSLNYKRFISEEEKKLLLEKTKEHLLQSLIGDWVKAILPEKEGQKNE